MTTAEPTPEAVEELRIERAKWEESSATWQTLYQQECDRRRDLVSRLDAVRDVRERLHLLPHPNHADLAKDLGEALDLALSGADWRPLPEDVTTHTMGGFLTHDDGRSCAFHARLRAWTFDGTKECLRRHR